MRCLFILVAVAPLGTSAQQVSRLVLAPPNASLAAEFSSLTWARELKDGRVIVTDARDGRIVVADLRTGKVEPISRRGQGPGEYPRALPVWSIGGDSSAMIDGPRRWLVFDGSRVVATLAPDNPAVAAAKGTARGADVFGHVFSAGTIAGENGPIGDSTLLLRVSRATAHVDTITRLKALVARQTSERNAEGYFSFVMPTIGTAEETLPFADGWVAVVRVDPYRVDWRSPEGSWTKGAALPFTIVRMDEREKRAYVERIAIATGNPVMPPETITDWPATVPPYQSSNRNLTFLLASPDGRAVIPRLASADHPETRYDIVNRRGVLDGQLMMPSNERIASFGAKSVYVAVTDDDGIQRLRRHPWPPVATPR
jgi:hypothetical protein